MNIDHAYRKDIQIKSITCIIDPTVISKVVASNLKLFYWPLLMCKSRITKHAWK